jgi:hypothetical protein
MSGLTFVPEAGAECVSSARSDLCGGRPKSEDEGRPYRDLSTTPERRRGRSSKTSCDACPRSREAFDDAVAFAMSLNSNADVSGLDGLRRLLPPFNVKAV